MPGHSPGVIADRERGSAIAEFAMISVLLVFLLFAVLQVAALFYVRSVVSAAAADGARHSAVAGAAAGDGAARATALIGRALTATVARQVPCQGRPDVDAATGLSVAQVQCSGRIRSIFLPLGAFVNVSATGRTLRERA